MLSATSADDVIATRENGLLAVASLYGFGRAEELAAAYAQAETPAGLAGIVRGMLEG